MSKRTKEIIGKPIKTYKLPLLERVAYCRPWFIFLFWMTIGAIIIVPTIWANYKNFWYYLLLIPLFLLMIFAIIGFFRWLYYRRRYILTKESEGQSKNHLENGVGENGKGKTLSYVNIMAWRADYQYEELCWDYWKICKNLKNPNYKLTDDEKEIVGAYKATVEGNGIPCLMTSLPVYSKKYKRFSYKLDIGHIKQQKRIPYRYCGFYDEIGASINVEKVYDRAKNVDGATDIEDFAKYMRHFCEFKFAGTEQNPRNIYLPLRSVSCDNRRFKDCEWVMKPKFLCWVFKKLKHHFLNKMYLWHAVAFSSFMEKFEKYINACGFWKLTWSSFGNIELGNVASKQQVITILQEGKDHFLYFPHCMEVKYNTRAYRSAYKPLCKKIELESWTSMNLTIAEAKSVLKSENLSKQKKTDE